MNNNSDSDNDNKGENDKEFSIEFVEKFLGDVMKVYRHGETFLTLNEENKEEYISIIREKDRQVLELEVKYNNLVTNFNNTLRNLSESESKNNELTKIIVQSQNVDKIRAYENHVISLNQQIKNKDDQIKSISEQSKNKDMELTTLKQQLMNKKNQITSLNQQLKNKNNQIT